MAQWEGLQPLLERLGITSQTAPLSATDLISDSGEGPWILLHTRPEYAIAHALDRGESAEQALAHWQAEAERLLAFYKSHRGQSVMVDIQAALESPRELTDWLKKNHSAFYQNVSAPPGNLPEVARPGELNLLLANQYVVQCQSLSGLIVQLEACSVPLGNGRYSAPSVDLDGVNLQLQRASEEARNNQRTLQQLDEHKKRLAELQGIRTQAERALKEENELLLTQLHKVQEELESYLHKHQNGAKNCEELTQANNALTTKLKSLEAECEQAKRELAAVEGEKTRLTQEVEQAEQSAKADCEALKQENSRLQQELKSATDAYSRATEQRQEAENEAKKLNSELSSVKEENDLILNQLFQVQEELEKRHLARAVDDRELAERKNASQALRQAEQKIQQQQRLLDRAEQALSQTEAQLSAHQKELADRKKQHNEETLAKLFQTQEELEQAVTRIDELVSELDQLTEKVEYLNDQVDSKNEKLRRFSDERRQLKARLKLAQDALAHEQAERGLTSLSQIAKPLRKLRRNHRLVDQQVHLIEDSDLFDKQWYAEQNPDVVAKFKNVAEHYIRHGGQEGRDPSPEFSSQGYLDNNPDVASTGMNPLVHYLLHGKAEGRKI